MKNFEDYINERTMSFGADNTLQMPDFSNAKHIGDIEDNKILFKQINGINSYAIAVGDKPVGFIYTRNKNVMGKDYLEIQAIFTEPEYRGKNFAKKLLFFMRNIEKQSLIFGDVQSRLGQSMIKSAGKSGRFPMFWLNTDTGEKHPYDFEKDDFNLKPYRGLGSPTGWVVMIEGFEGSPFTSRFLEQTNGNYYYWHKGIRWFVN